MFIDVHAHVYRKPSPPVNGPQVFFTPEQLLARCDEHEIERAVLLPFGNSEVYLPQSNDDIIEIAEARPDRFIPFCNVDPRAISNSPGAPLGNLLRYYRDRGCKGIGEVMPNLRFLDPRVQNLFGCAEEAGLPLTFDITVREGERYGLVDDLGLPELERSLKNFPGLKVFGHGPAFWAEMGRLETPCDRVGYPDYPITEEGVVPELFRRYPNLFGDLSAGSGYNALARDPEHAVRFLNEFQDRLMFGTDSVAPGSPLPMKGFLLGLREEGKISEIVFQKIARENAIRILGLDD